MCVIVKLWPGSHKHFCHGNTKKVLFIVELRMSRPTVYNVEKCCYGKQKLFIVYIVVDLHMLLSTVQNVLISSYKVPSVFVQ
jgi:hypothetical protein